MPSILNIKLLIQPPRLYLTKKEFTMLMSLNKNQKQALIALHQSSMVENIRIIWETDIESLHILSDMGYLRDEELTAKGNALAEQMIGFH